MPLGTFILTTAARLQEFPALRATEAMKHIVRSSDKALYYDNYFVADSGSGAAPAYKEQLHSITGFRWTV
jgi:hypothetical protein